MKSDVECPVVVSVHSHKGGVGKTSIALGSAIELAARGKKVLVIDVDLTGASLAEAIPFANAPFRTTNGLTKEKPIDLSSFQREMSRRTENFAGSSIPQPLILFLNDYLMEFPDVAANPLDYMWNWALDYQGIHMIPVLPSSPHVDDIKEMLRISGCESVEFVRQGIRDLVTTLADSYDFVLVDTSPGLYSLSLSLASEDFGISDQKRRQRWLVSTPEKADLISAYRCWHDCRTGAMPSVPRVFASEGDKFILNRWANSAHGTIVESIGAFLTDSDTSAKTQKAEAIAGSLDCIRHAEDFNIHRLLTSPSEYEQTFLRDVARLLPV